MEKQISNLLSPYKPSRTNTALLMVTALEEYRSSVGNLERKIQELEIENEVLRRKVLFHRDPEDPVTTNPQEGNDLDSSFHSLQKLNTIQTEIDTLAQESGDTTCMQRQVLTSLMDYLNSNTNGDLEMTKLRASKALETLKDSMTDIYPNMTCDSNDKVCTLPMKGYGNESGKMYEVTTCTAITMDFLQKLTCHVGDAIDLDSKITKSTQSNNENDLHNQSTLFIQNDALIQALTLFINERDKFIEEVLDIFEMSRTNAISNGQVEITR
jgi:hypothetical protein